MMICFCIFNFANSPQECTRNYLRMFKNPKYSGGGAFSIFPFYLRNAPETISEGLKIQNYLGEAFSFHLRNAPETISEGLKIIWGRHFHSPQECTRNYLRRFKNPHFSGGGACPQTPPPPSCCATHAILLA